MASTELTYADYLELPGDDFELAGIYREVQTFSSPTLEGFTINLDDTF